MVALYIIAGIIAFFVIVFSVFNISLRVIFDSAATDDIKIYAKIGFYKIYIVPEKKEKLKKPEKRALKKARPEKERAQPEVKEKKQYSVGEAFELIKNIGETLLKTAKKHLKAKIYGIDLILASDEAEKTAVLYGAAVQSAHYLFEFLNYNFKINIKSGSVRIIPDFIKTKSEFKINIKFYMKLSSALGLLLASALKYLKFSKKPA